VKGYFLYKIHAKRVYVRRCFEFAEMESRIFVNCMAKIKINVASGGLMKDETVPKKKIAVGIDLGTTNSLVAWVNPANGNAEIIQDRWGALVPSIVALPPDAEPVVGIEAKGGLVTDPQRTIFSVKRLLGRSYADVQSISEHLGYRIIDDNNEQLVRILVDGKFYSPIELSAIILKRLKEKAEVELDAEITGAVITVPAYFNDSQRQATRDAAKIAGLPVLRIINEPTAASLAYGISGDSLAKNVLVYDLGGGTFDVSILTLEDGVFEVLSTHGDTALGGDDLDRAVMEFWLQQNPALNALYNQAESATIQSFRLAAEKAKRHVCGDMSQVYRGKLWWNPSSRLFQVRDENLEEAPSDGAQAVAELSLNYTQLLSCTQGIIEKTQQSVKFALRDAGLSAADINEVVLVGGSTRFPRIQQFLIEEMGFEKVNNTINPDEVVALGAAIEADVLSGNRSDVLLLDVTPLSLGIETAGKLMDVLIPRNTKIPFKVAREYTTSVDGQVNMRIAVFQGERELVDENRKLGEFILKNIPAMPAGFPKIQVAFVLDANGMLTVKAKELRSGISQDIEIKPQYGLSDQEVEQMLMDGFVHAKEDVEKRMVQEAINEGKQMVYTAERFIEKNHAMLSDEEMEGTKQRINDLRGLLENTDSDRNAILDAVTRLNDYTRPFAERLMDQAIAVALKGKII
jgi:molecular chaperone HscA